MLPESFDLPREVMPTLGVAEHAEILLPLPLGPDAPTIRGREDYNIIGKLKRGVALEQAQAEMDALTARLRRDHPEEYPPNGGLTFSIVPLQEQVVGDVRRSLVDADRRGRASCCSSPARTSRTCCCRARSAVSGKLRSARRSAPSACRIVRQLLTESVLLALAGGALGVVFAFASLAGDSGARNAKRAAPPRDRDRRTASCSSRWSSRSRRGCCSASHRRCGCRGSISTSNLKDASRGSSGVSALWGRGQNLRRLLVIAELALSVVLLIGAGLLIRSFARIQDVPPGFNPQNVLTLELTMMRTEVQRRGRRARDVSAALGPAGAAARRHGRRRGVRRFHSAR